MRRLITSASLAMLAFTFASGSSESGVNLAEDGVFARINELVISQSEFEQIFAAAVRHKYYHGKVPIEELENFRQQVTEDIVTQVLVHDQALQQGLQADREKIDQGIDSFNLRNANNPDWESRREKIIPRLIERLERQDLIEQMERQVRNIPQPNSGQVRQYYRDRPDKFTEPESLRLAVILLAVSPTDGETVWSETENRAADIIRRIELGEDFAALAKTYSDHASAAAGGDLGFLHRGVLEPRVQEKIETLSPNQLSEPIRVLEGVTLFLLQDVKPARAMPFDQVEERARNLLYRELQDEAWNSYVEQLRSAASIYVNR